MKFRLALAEGVELECLVDVSGVDFAAELLYQIDAVGVGGIGVGGVGELAVFVESCGVVDASREVPVAVDVVWGDGAHTCPGVVDIAHGEAVPVDIGYNAAIKLSLLLHVAPEIKSYIVGARVAEVRVTEHDVERVAVIAVVNEIGHAGLGNFYIIAEGYVPRRGPRLTLRI